MGSIFEQTYLCYPVSFLEKSHLEKGDKVLMPASALDQLAYMQIEYPMLFELHNPSDDRVSHCGVLEFIADEGLIYLPYWMMQNMHLQEGDLVNVKNVSLPKGTYIKLQPHTMDFLDVSNPKAVLEATLRNYTCLTTGDTIMVPYSNKNFHINILETKPFSAVSVVETDCTVDFAPPLDYKEPEKPVRPNKAPPPSKVQEEEPTKKVPKVSPFTGLARRLDGKPTTEAQTAQPSSSSSAQNQHDNGSNRPSGKLIFGSNGEPTLNEKTVSKKRKEEVPEKAVERPKFQAFTGKKYSLQD